MTGFTARANSGADVRIIPEQMSGLYQSRCPDYTGMDVRITPEWMPGCSANPVRPQAEYALKLIQPSYKHKTSLKSIRKKFGWDLISQLMRMLGHLDEKQIAQALQLQQPKPNK